MLRIAHLIDDTNPGGVTRYLDFLANDPAMASLARHEVVRVSRNRTALARVEADIIVSHLTVTWRGMPGLMLLRARYAGTPMVHVEHSYCSGFAATNVRAPRRFQSLLRTAYALFDHVVAVSEGQARWLRLRGLVQGEALSVIPPRVDLAPFSALPAPRGPVRTIGAIGRFDRQKGFDMLIRAFRGTFGPHLRLHMIGDGPERALLEMLAGDDPRICFTGFAENPAAAMAQCDAVAMPSRWEPYGLVALEAAAAQRSLLVSGVDGLSDHVAAGAIPVGGGSVSEWRDALQTLADAPAPAAPELPGTSVTLDAWAALLDRVERQRSRADWAEEVALAGA